MKKSTLPSLKFTAITVISALICICVVCADNSINERSPNNNGEVDRFLGEKYKITFDGNGGTVSPSSDTTDANGNITLPSAPKKDGYTFDGWYTAATGGNKVTMYTVFDKNTTIYARWTLITYTITFNSRGGSVSPTGTTGEGGTLSSLPTPTRNGYTFVGWFTATEGGTAVNTSTVFDRNTIIYAQWTLITYTITFNPNSGSVNPTSGTTGEGGTLASLPTPTRNGYTFVGWFTSSSGGNEVTTYTVFDKTTTIYAQWTLITYTITFDANGGSVNSTSGTTGAGGRLSSLPTPTRNGYTFNGWFTEITGGTAVTENTTFGVNATVYARWTQQYTITFNSNGGSGTVSTLSVPSGSSVTLPSGSGLSRRDNTFGGWNTDSSGTGNNYNAGSSYTPTDNVTLYAKWNSNCGTNFRTVTIGTQKWMAENLNCDIQGSMCYYNSNDNCNKYGRLYNWNTALTACPSGWHLPSDAEWTTLENYVGGSSTAGTKLKSQTGWYQNYGTDEYGFSALPGGVGSRSTHLPSIGVGDGGFWWSATEDDASSAWYRSMVYGNENVGRNSNSKTTLLSVRCVQD